MTRALDHESFVAITVNGAVTSIGFWVAADCRALATLNWSLLVLLCVGTMNTSFQSFFIKCGWRTVDMDKGI